MLLDIAWARFHQAHEADELVPSEHAESSIRCPEVAMTLETQIKSTTSLGMDAITHTANEKFLSDLLNQTRRGPFPSKSPYPQEKRPQSSRPNASENTGVSELQEPLSHHQKPMNRIAHKTRGGRVMKSIAKRTVVGGVRSPRVVLTLGDAPIPGHPLKLRGAAGVIDELDELVAQIPQRPCKRQRQSKVYKKSVRTSRRLAGEPSEFGMLPYQRVVPPLDEPPLRYPSNGCQMNLSPSSNRSSSNNKLMPVKGARPQGIVKPRHQGPNRSNKFKKRSGD
jgi:hypothetical protein